MKGNLGVKGHAGHGRTTLRRKVIRLRWVRRRLTIQRPEPVHTPYSVVKLDFAYRLFKRAMLETDISFGHSASQA